MQYQGIYSGTGKERVTEVEQSEKESSVDNLVVKSFKE